ncbi:hypothetical protein GND95_08690 [Defluviitalea raffinosedens]|uniref:Uncharacterized protein n=1 Tax=Defluviitalea raffinosedens TaxID=1450156 RepID=A0A7C8HH88_9FIRM|nr:Rho termination factor N-terminal domain-containing protein [Defluviitalea raffinosedens]KAE9633722.1 hypothetical protein GND95_08690 [Defluviitalea raffinosedens]
MYKLVLDNTVRLTNSEIKKNELLEKGYKLVKESEERTNLEKLKVEELKALAQEKNIEGFEKMKKGNC